jgi:SecD/SecF fusion protein
VSEKRRNLGILALVIALMAASAGVVVVRGFTLGLDLRGGLEVVLKARPIHGNTISSTDLQNAANVMRRRIDPHGILQPEIRTSTADNTIDISIPGVKNPNAVANLLVAGQLQSFDLYHNLAPPSRGTQSQFQSKPQSLFAMLTASKRLLKPGEAPSGWALFNAKTHDLVSRDGLRSRIEPQKAQVLNDIHLATQPAGTVFLAVPHGDSAVSCDEAVGCPDAPGGTKTVWYLFHLPTNDSEIVTGDEISSAQSTTDQNGNPIVSLSYKNGGGSDFQKITAQIANEGSQVGTPLPNAIVVDNQLVATPTIDYTQFPNGIDANNPTSPGSEITNLSKSEADRIALEIQSGTLPVKFSPYSQSLVSATLGKDSLRNGLIAGAAGLAFVMVFLLLFYGFLGLIADIALIIYGLLLAGIVAALPVTMTLPGIAGTILTIGVAADANIVIFERVKEEVRAGKSMRAAIATGYRRGFHTIIDANVVTLIAAGVLYAAATSSVKGFALMLLIGVITSIFTAVVATRAMLGALSGMQFMGSRWVLGSVGTGDRWKRFDFIGRKRFWFAMSGLILVIGALSLGTKGLNRGIDFTGGSKLTFVTPHPESVGAATGVVSGAGINQPQVQGVSSTKGHQGSNYTQFQVESHFLTDTVRGHLDTSIKSHFGQQAKITDFQEVSSSFGQSVLNSAYLAVLFSLIIIFIYVSFRFEWKYALPVMIALGHDILLTIGIYSLAGRVVTADTVAAVLTVLGYSMYDTVIVFDRVRENIPILRRHTASQVVNESLAETITRSLNTSLVTLIPVILLFVFGSGSLKDFAFALVVGITSGAYSSIFIAAPLLAIFLEREPGFAKRRHDIEHDEEIDTTPRRRRRGSGQAPLPTATPATDGPPASAAPAPAPSSSRRRRRRSHGRAR